MENSYTLYLCYVILIAGVFVMLLIMLVKKFKNQNRIYGKQTQNLIHSGSISIFFDRSGNSTVIPYTKDKVGLGRAAKNIIFLKQPCNAVKLGAAVRNSLNLCDIYESCSDSELLKRLKVKSWDEFSEGRRNVSVYYSEKHGIIFNSTIRQTKGVYRLNNAHFEKVLEKSADDRQLGEAVLEVLKRCRI